MEVLLLSDIKGIGKKSDVVVVGNGYALNFLLPGRKALVVTPNVRKRYAELIKKRAIERESEKSRQGGTAKSLEGKVVHFSSKVTKTGKLYAAITAKMIVDSLGKQHGILLDEEQVKIQEPIKSVGMHTVPVHLGELSGTLSVEVKDAGEEKGAKKKGQK